MQTHTAFLPFGLGGSGPRLFCLPFAGGGASAFVGWRRQLSELALAPVQYPGRETRLDEALAENPIALAEEIVSALTPHLSPQHAYGLLGYSLGARLAFVCVQILQMRGLPLPAALHVVAHRAPDLPPTRAGVAALPEHDFREHVRTYGGTPDEVFDTPELAEMLLPILRADFALAEQAIPLNRVDCPIYAYAGIDDPVASPQQMQRWEAFTTVGLKLRSFAGGHFFVREHKDFFHGLENDVRQWR